MTQHCIGEMRIWLGKCSILLGKQINLLGKRSNLLGRWIKFVGKTQQMDGEIKQNVLGRCPKCKVKNTPLKWPLSNRMNMNSVILWTNSRISVKVNSSKLGHSVEVRGRELKDKGLPRSSFWWNVTVLHRLHKWTALFSVFDKQYNGVVLTFMDILALHFVAMKI